MESATFTADAALLRELGERLLGRSYIALAELVKNAYDADATTCRIEFGKDEITVVDDGHGMSKQEFHDHWMRIGTTHKTDKKTSRCFHRPMTGSKGLGRLSVQFLAEKMTLESTSADEPSLHLYAVVDWTGIQRGQDLKTVDVLWEMRPGDHPGSRGTGTRIVLKALRSTWDADGIGSLGEQVWMLQPPYTYRRFGKWSDGAAHDFYVDIVAPDIERAREEFRKFENALFGNWKACIRGTLADGRSGPPEGRRAEVTVEFKKGYPKDVKADHSFREDVALPVDPKKAGEPAIDQVKFEIFVFKPAGRQSGGLSVQDMREYLHKFGNVSVYDGGFRLPYYGASQDWLNIAVDQGRRLVTSALLPSSLHIGERYLLDLPAPGRIFGWVEIDTSHERAVAERLRADPGSYLLISAGRDRLADNAAFDQLRSLVRFALDFYANRHRFLLVRAAEKAGKQADPPSRIYGRAAAILADNRDELPEAAYREIQREILTARRTAAAEEETVDRRAEMLAPLATAGMTALALNHELGREAALLDRARDEVRRVATMYGASGLAEIVDDLDATAARIGALQRLFGPLLSEEDRAATDRLRVHGIVRQVVQAFESSMGRVSFDFRSIPGQLRFPVGAFVEWSALLQNVLTNAWDAMLDADQASISFDGGRGARAREWLRISDTGVGIGVPLKEAETLFEPFERRLRISDENRSIAMGGQGLGLAIVRMIARRRAVRVAFVRPKPGFATTLEISWRGTLE